MTTTIGKGADLMEVLKKKMRQAKEDTERLKDDNEELSRKLQIEVQRREADAGGDVTRTPDALRRPWVLGVQGGRAGREGDREIREGCEVGVPACLPPSCQTHTQLRV
ncbi:Tropomyosin-1, isoforms 9A/A/B [Portunus trituberculatus]|uniref:Tropomyosin-1, isoforms 9A/A/B n=1 Tax=Portunus trituberculatus TaxID=210409 RepID=A0A5B7IKQ9_PORTR|nr:Tropomyosin-1, isoforms 9A/A/B [Portunus trituberculatus]